MEILLFHSVTFYVAVQKMYLCNQQSKYPKALYEI